ncbi:MAG TPA: hypothetical protein PK324_14625, partial [Nocardioides sp.]|nr:hypothetical protein [Nocardioides sp.]
MDARTIVNRGVTTSLRLGRGTADRVVSVAGPRLGRLTDQVMARVRRTERPATATFTPSKQPPGQSSSQPPTQPVETESEAPSSSPSPARVARNIAPQRPGAKPARTA